MRLPQSCSIALSIRVVSITTLLAFSIMLALPAQGTTQQLQCSPTSLKFGEVALGQAETQLVTVTNTGKTEASVSAISASASGFSVSAVNLPLNLEAGQSITLNVVFAPTAAGWAGGQVTFKSNTSDKNLQLGVAGEGVQSVALTAAPSSLSFGQLAVGSQETLPVVLTNTRSWKVTLTGFQATGSGFLVSGPSAPVVLSGGKSVTLNVTFTAQSAGLTQGSVLIGGPAISVPLTATGTTTGQLTVAPTAMNFGSVDVGNTTTQPLTMSASGGSVTVSSAASSSSQFATSGASFPLTINAGQSVAVNVVFAPTKSGSSSGTLTFASNASNTQTTESLTGTGVLPQYSVNLSWSGITPPVAGYNVYRGTAVGSYARINTALDPDTTYADNTVASGVTYYYAATAVSLSGQESGYSTPVEVAVP